MRGANYFLLLILSFVISGCADRPAKILGSYDIEYATQTCHGLDLERLIIEENKITIKGGGNITLIESLAKLGESFGATPPPEQKNLALENNRRFRDGYSIDFKHVEVADRIIRKKEWDMNSLDPDGILFTKAYKLLRADGQHETIFTDEVRRVGIQGFEKCIFRKAAVPTTAAFQPAQVDSTTTTIPPH
jgi:hypothetical protein